MNYHEYHKNDIRVITSRLRGELNILGAKIPMSGKGLFLPRPEISWSHIFVLGAIRGVFGLVDQLDTENLSNERLKV